MMHFIEYLASGDFGLSEGSMYERLRRNANNKFDTHIAHGGIIYNAVGIKALRQLHEEYLDVGKRYGMAMFALTDTWRSSAERIDSSEFRGRRVNEDNAAFLDSIRRTFNDPRRPVYLGGLLGPKGDAYKPAEAPPTEDALDYHTPQVDALAGTAVDFLCAMAMPAFAECLGMARAMARTGLPYVLSFVIRPDGRLLDNTPIVEAIGRIDNEARQAPAGYGVNCVHPEVLHSALKIIRARDSRIAQRLVSFQANTSRKRPEELDGLEALETEDPETLADLMVGIRNEYGINFMGGCCGTDGSHIESLAKQYRAAQE